MATKSIGKVRLTVAGNGRVRLEKPGRRLDVSARIRQKTSKKVRVVKPKA